MDQDGEHLRLLSIVYYVLAGVIGLLVCFPLVYLAIGAGLLLKALGAGPDGASGFVGIFFVVMAGTCVVCGGVLALCLFVAGRSLAARRRYVYCFVIGVVSCFFVPVGTVLGIFTILVLMRPSVKELFAAQREMEAGGWTEGGDTGAR